MRALAIALLSIVALVPGAYADDENWQKLTGRRWIGETVDGKAVVDPGSITLIFGGERQAYGTGGCNSFQGPVANLSGSRLEFGLFAATQKACEKPGVMDQESQFLFLLQSAKRYGISDDGFLTISTEDRKRLKFSQQPAGGLTPQPAAPPTP